MFLGGTETTSTTIEWAMAELVKNPKIMKKAQDEVRKVVGTKLIVHKIGIHQMEYLKCIIKETLRLYPSIPMYIPRVSYTCTKVNTYDIHANTTVLINPWKIQRNFKVWDNTDDFNISERFSNN
ncbi:hypothetical protein GIB67_032877 [Kingdonia uniflora]|uniref:Cytochrome P450 n=1 Tax=Kingdonia uniflora TaxID=39325 RepID=A0A7J7NBK9_9MAGN|nr:hypothetical protein GIB67_032877 [Kingdonia uniflora]